MLFPKYTANFKIDSPITTKLIDSYINEIHKTDSLFGKYKIIVNGCASSSFRVLPSIYRNSFVPDTTISFVKNADDYNVQIQYKMNLFIELLVLFIIAYILYFLISGLISASFTVFSLSFMLTLAIVLAVYLFAFVVYYYTVKSRSRKFEKLFAQ